MTCLLNVTMWLTITGFVAIDDDLFAVTSLLGTVLEPSGEPSQSLFEGILRPVRVRRATPTLLRLEFEAVPIELAGVAATQSRATIEIRTRSESGVLQGHLLRAFAELQEDPYASVQQLAELLNRLLFSLL